jgi:hypothetical protein
VQVVPQGEGLLAEPMHDRGLVLGVLVVGFAQGSFRGLRNVPWLSCGRIRKPGGCRWREGGVDVGDEMRPSASTACWAASGEMRLWR